MEYRQVGQIPVLQYVCMPILVPCRQSKILGRATRISYEYMRSKPGRCIPKLMSKYTENSVNPVMKKGQFR